MTLRSILTTWSENVDDYMEDFRNEIKESFRTYSLVSLSEKEKPESTPYSNAKYQEDLLAIQKSVLTNLDMAKVQVETHKKLVEEMHTLGKIDSDFYVEMMDSCEELIDDIGLSVVEVGIYYAKYKGSSAVDLNINFKTNEVHVSSL